MDLLSTFSRAAETCGATVERVNSSTDAVRNAVQRRCGKSNRVAVADFFDLPPEYSNACRSVPGVIPTVTKSQLASAEIGITEAFAGIAATGSVCVFIGEGNAGVVSLLVREHIVLLASRSIVERPGDLFRSEFAIEKALRSDFVIVTGPSATADMGPLVRGVHGPHGLHIILMD